MFMQYRKEIVKVEINGSLISISAPTMRAKRWGVSQLKREAAKLGITLKRTVLGYKATDPRALEENKFLLIQALKECWVSPTDWELRKSVNRRTVLDKGF